MLSTKESILGVKNSEGEHLPGVNKDPRSIPSAPPKTKPKQNEMIQNNQNKTKQIENSCM